LFHNTANLGNDKCLYATPELKTCSLSLPRYCLLLPRYCLLQPLEAEAGKTGIRFRIS